MGEAWATVFGLVDDVLIELFRDAVDARFPSRAPSDALPELAHDRRIDIGFDEPADSVRERIRKAFSKYSFYGTRKDIEDSLRVAGYTDFEIRDASQDGSLRWFEFEVVIFHPFPWVDSYLSDQAWDAAGTWDDGGNWAEDMPQDQLERVRSIVRAKPTHARCRSILIVHDGDTWDSDAPPGTWDDDPLAQWTDNVSTLSAH